MATYDYIDQEIVATTLIEPKANDSFYYPVNQGHNGFAYDGQLYTAGVLQSGQVASWHSEVSGPYRGPLPTFPTAGLVLLSKVALTILDESTSALGLWMQFLLSDTYALANNFDGGLNGWVPAGLTYADGIISVTYNPDPGNQVGLDAVNSTYGLDSRMVVNLDFSQDTVYLDVATSQPLAS